MTSPSTAPAPEAGPAADASERYRIARLLEPRNAGRLGAVAAAVVALAAGLAWAGGWLSPGRLDQTRIIDTFEAVSGVHDGFRRNHAKGVCLTGVFESSGAAGRYSTAAVFKAGRVPVYGRFSLAGGMPRQPDGPSAVHSMALNFTLPDGEVWRTAMVDIPVFPARDERAFYEQLVAMRPDPKTGKPDGAKMQAFLGAHPESARALALIRAHPFPSGFANAAYNALNAFLLVDDAGKTTPVRWSMVPVDAFAPAAPDGSDDVNYLFDALSARLARGPAQWHLVLTLGRSGDPTGDATMPWPSDRQRIDAGTLTVTALETESAGNCRDINFDPLVLPAGIAPSDDPLLSARSAAYSVSFTRRAGERKSPSAVQIGKGR